VSTGELRLTTDEQREQLYVAQQVGGLCAACGRTLNTGEAVYIESVRLELKPLTAPGAQWSRTAVRRDAPLGRECASAEFLARTESLSVELCGWCERPVYHEIHRMGRTLVSCSKRCAFRVRTGRGRG
jgi:hypothetical protein